MSSETYSFLGLRELIEAKAARRAALLDEVARIDTELADARALLAPAGDTRKRIRPLVTKPCERCRHDFEGAPLRRFCTTCFRITQAERMAAGRASHKRQRLLAVGRR